jgi:A/G-specific adenine glycosylase
VLFSQMDRFSTLITAWYRQNARDLPWRDTRNPYFIWLSEIILQQTRVEQGMPYYLKFVKNYPTIEHLAEASEDEVLNDWQGLGYYSRARNLQSAARYVVRDLNSDFPNTYDEIIKMKGVGEYTASAISSFAFNEVHAVLDGNVYRLLSRYYNLPTPIDSTIGKKEFKLLADELIDPKNPAEHNQAIMEMGALICTPKNPNCENCSLNESCLALENGTIEKLPVKEKKTKVRERHFNYLVIKEGVYTYLRKRGPKDVWQGLYDFPLVEKKVLLESDLDDYVVIHKSEEFKHILSHQKIYANFWELEFKQGGISLKEYEKVKIEDLDNYPMPQLLIRYLEKASYLSED